MNITRSTRLLMATLCVATLSATTALAFTATEDFGSYTAPTSLTSGLGTTSGAGTAGTGASGNGWLTGWRSAATSGASATAGVINTTPVKSGGNYFSATLTSSATTGALDSVSVGRAYDATGGSLASATSLSMSFDFRVDSITTSRTSYDIFDNKTRSSGASASNTSFQFRAVNGVWNYFDGSSSTPIATTLAFTQGVTYSFNVTLNPASATYSFIISDGTNSASGNSLGFRASSFATDTTTGSVGGRWLTVAGFENSDNASQSTSFSLDNIAITTAIPEPSSAALLIGAASLALVATRKRRR